MADPRDKLVEKVAQEIHEGLGGSGWGYSCYGGNEDHHLANELQSMEGKSDGADEIAAAIRALIPGSGS